MNEYEKNQKWIDAGLPLCGWGLYDYDPYEGLTEEEYYALLGSDDDFDDGMIVWQKDE